MHEWEGNTRIKQELFGAKFLKPLFLNLLKAIIPELQNFLLLQLVQTAWKRSYSQKNELLWYMFQAIKHHLVFVMLQIE